MVERCPDCERPLSTVADDYVLGLTEDRCIQVNSDGSYLMSNCSEHTIRLLRAKLTKLEAVMESVRAYGRDDAAEEDMWSALHAYDDAAKAKLEKVER